VSNLRKSLIRLAHSKPELRENLLPLLKQARSKNFADFNWREIAQLMGGKLLRSDAKEIHVWVPKLNDKIIITDNGGEVNISVEKPLIPHSVPYTSSGFTVREETLAYRLWNSITGKPIDYSFDVDSEGA